VYKNLQSEKAKKTVLVVHRNGEMCCTLYIYVCAIKQLSKWPTLYSFKVFDICCS
jgi:ATP-dependent Clp protease adapter protein ClpS